MENRTKKCGAQLQQHSLFRKSITYLAKIAVVLQGAPGKMLTFTQLMDKLAPLICEDRKSVENNIRVCLSTHSCFVKIPVVPDSFHSKRNYWKLDSGEITAKMVRRHFKGILQLFPELASKVETEETSGGSGRCSALGSALGSPQAAACGAVRIRCEAKFSSPFSIESLLKRDGPSRASPLCSVPLRAGGPQQPRRRLSWDSEEPVLLQASAGRPSMHHGLAANSLRRMHVNTEASFPVYTGAAPYFSSSYITYSLPAFTHDALCFRL